MICFFAFLGFFSMHLCVCVCVLFIPFICFDNYVFIQTKQLKNKTTVSKCCILIMNIKKSNSLVTAILLLVTITFMLSICTKLIHVRKYLDFTNEGLSHCVNRELFDTYVETITQEHSAT